MSDDLHPTQLNIYGYCVAWIPGDAASWTMEEDDEYRNLPAHYPTLNEAIDRAAYLKEKGFQARALALVMMPTDAADEFESAKIQQPE